MPRSSAVIVSTGFARGGGLAASNMWRAACLTLLHSACSQDPALSLDAGSRPALNPPSEAGVAIDAGVHTPGTAEASAPLLDAGDWLAGDSFSFQVPEDSAVGIDLGSRTVVTSVVRENLNWDLAFRDFSVFTNSGPSGVGQAGAIGPLDPLNLVFDEAPPIAPFPDHAAGALTGWYRFTQSGIESRFHIYAIESAGHLWKLQILSYHAETDAGRTSGIYQLRYARLDNADAAGTVELTDVDASAGGLSPSADAAGACINLETGKLAARSPLDWQTREDWHVCLRRSDVVTNGGYSGPGSVVAVDLDATDPAFDEAVERTAESELERFEGVTFDTLSSRDLDYTADEDIWPAIGTNWVQAVSATPTLTEGIWLVRDADGSRQYLVLFADVNGGTTDNPGTVTLRVKEVTSAPIAAAH